MHAPRDDGQRDAVPLGDDRGEDRGPWGPRPRPPAPRARRAAAGTLRVVVGLPLFAVEMAVGAAIVGVARLADLIEGRA